MTKTALKTANSSSGGRGRVGRSIPHEYTIVKDANGNLDLQGIELGELKTDREAKEWIASMTGGKKKAASKAREEPDSTDDEEDGGDGLGSSIPHEYTIVTDANGNLDLQGMELRELKTDREAKEWIASMMNASVTGGKKKAASRAREEAGSTDDEEDGGGRKLSPYELQRKAKIERNQARLAQLGLLVKPLGVSKLTKPKKKVRHRSLSLRSRYNFC